jgi:hypothetical protein
MEETREALFQQAHELGIEKDEAYAILKRNGINERYIPENHKKYLGILSAHSKIMARILRVTNHKPDNFIPVDKCPVCGMEVERDFGRDGSLGSQHGWKCANPDQGAVSHFVIDRLERIRPWLQRNQGMSDPEMNSGMENNVEVSPSGGNLTESFKNISLDVPIEIIGLQRTEVLEPDLLM